MRMVVPLPALGTLLDLPAGVSVTGVDGTEGVVVLHLDGVDSLGDEADVITAEYDDGEVPGGHRRFLRFMAPEPVTAPTDPPVPPAKAAGATTKKAGS